MTNPCALVISVFLRPVSTRRRRWTHKEPLRNKLPFTPPSLHIPHELHYTISNPITSTRKPHYQHDVPPLQARNNPITSTRQPPHKYIPLPSIWGRGWGWGFCGFVVPPVTSPVRYLPSTRHLPVTLSLIINHLHRHTPQNGTMSLKTKMPKVNHFSSGTQMSTNPKLTL